MGATDDNPAGSLRRFEARLISRDFECFRRPVYEQCGIRLPAHKQSMLEARLRSGCWREDDVRSQQVKGRGQEDS